MGRPVPRTVMLLRLILVSSLAIIPIVLLPTSCDKTAVPERMSEAARLARFEQQLEDLRVRLRIPGMSAAIAEGNQIIWSRGFGHADRESGTPAGAETMFHVASLTKPYASTVLLQLVEEGRLDLDTPVSEFGVESGGEGSVRVWHLLSHTSADPPGSSYRYDGAAFGELEKVVEGVTKRSFAAELSDRIIRPLQLGRTAPNPEDARDFAASGLELDRIEPHLARGYAPAWGRGVWPSGLFGPMRPMDHPTSFHPAAGLVASAPDVARFSVALDQGKLLSQTSRELATRAITTPSGEPLPYALGWFVQEHEGTKLVWHYGHWFSSSALIVKVPDRRLTFVLLANSDGLSRRRRLGDHGNLLKSPAARAFLETFVSHDRPRS